VTLADALLVGKSYAQKNNYPMDADQQLFSFGAANVASTVTGGFMVGSSASRTAAMDGSGSRTQIPSLVGGAIVAVVVVLFTDLLALLPSAVLAGIVANAVLALIEIKEIRELLKVRRDEALVAITCALGVLMLGSLKAVILAFVLSTIMLTRRSSETSTAVLGTVDGQPGLFSTRRHTEATTIPGLTIFRFSGPLYFANSDTFLSEISKIIEQTDPPVSWFVLDAEAISDIDSTGADAFSQVLDLAEKHQVTFAIARLESGVRDLLKTYDLLDRIGDEHLYRTNAAAEQAFVQRASSTSNA
jgi:MFS superfamily sulfate permease-like transporter